MFTKPLDYICLPSELKNSFEEISKTSHGLDGVSFEAFQDDLQDNLHELSESIIKGEYAPEPLKTIEIDKLNSDEKRAIALSAIKDKIVQHLIYTNLNSYYDKLFCDKSYAYRPEKSTLKALNRVSDFLNRGYRVIVKTDIDNFFDTIDHAILLKLLHQEIKDNSLIRLISLLIQTGTFKSFNYDEHALGVHQGDILSPLLSNIYLNEMDQWLENYKIAFVRYADDFVLMFQNFNEARGTLLELKKFLGALKLSLEETKTSIVHIKDGFEFLGVRFEGKQRFVENERFQKSLSKIHKIGKRKQPFYHFVKELNSYLQALKNYYLKLIEKSSTQIKQLQDAAIESASQKVYKSKETKEIKSKKEFRILLEQVKFDLLFDQNISEYIELIIAIGYEKYLSNKSYKDSTVKINRKRDKYVKKFANDATLHVNQPGLSLGISKNKFVLKEYGRVKKSYPLDKVQRIILEGKGFSLSSNVIQKCAQNSITIDFIDRNAFPYASLITYKSSIAQTIHKQAMLLNTQKHLDIAKAFIKGKAKNQINYLKYLDKYHRLLDRQIDTMEKNFIKIKTAKTVEELMGIEGSLSVSYWAGVRLVLEVPFEKRITQGAKDIVNSSLNYAYAILYGKVQHSLVHAGLSLNISFLHALDGNKPTLTFDMIEEFRTFIADRTIISMLNKEEPIKLAKDGLLTKPSRQLISKNIKEKLGSYTMWKKESHKIENIIMTQCYSLAKAITDENVKYKPFIGKF